jgi:hypothetical protein
MAQTVFICEELRAQFAELARAPVDVAAGAIVCEAAGKAVAELAAATAGFREVDPVIAMTPTSV